MSLVLGRVLSACLMAGMWLISGVRLVLDLIGYSTIAEDAEQAGSLAHRFFLWLLELPSWATWGAALAATCLLIWVSWPRTARTKVEPARVEAGAAAVQPPPQAINPLETYFSRKVIRLADLVNQANFVVEGKIFEDCELHGPGVFTFIPGKPLTFRDNVLNGDSDTIFIELSDKQAKVGGVIGFNGCSFVRCRFYGLALIGPKELIAHFRERIPAC